MNSYQIERIHEYGELSLEVSIQTLTTIRIGGKAMAVFYPSSILSLQAMIQFCKEEQIPWFVFGNGSNILASDEDYNGIIIKLTRDLTSVYRISDTKFEIFAGASLIALAQKARKLGLSGLEWAAGIPASVGGATYMNAGAYKQSMADVITEVCVLRDGEIEWIANADCQFAYRSSIFKKHLDWVIVAVRLQLQKGDRENITALMNDRQQRRMASQPLEFASFGSTFRNPSPQFAWEMIDSCQLRGYQIGGAQVSQKHTNFLINSHQASFLDMMQLIQLIQTKVYDKYRMNLELEVEIFNWTNANRTQ